MTLEQVKAKLAAIKGARLVRAEQAIAAGIAIITVPATGKRAVVVGSKSGNGCYTVTGTGCTCKGWQGRGYCCHSDAVYLMLAARAAQKEQAATAAAPAGGDDAVCRWCGVAYSVATVGDSRYCSDRCASADEPNHDALYGLVA